ncbi:hypothetical protein RHMOL_Rhmol07G0282700 [Rhododendron molle]|uniref:Uncharacterized protein n=1 Tax=Rhododendron molle TaxID=49168 RepID=A0ACC0N6R1_RHOML|nr:hypothetical protein RHMOL_Rhmol07G0282700 [Rhododendron molle]
MNHPEFLSNPFYVGGDSYAGITVPAIVQLISNGKKIVKHWLGYLLGNPVTISAIENNYAIPFAHGMGLISDEHYEKSPSQKLTFLSLSLSLSPQSLQRNCKGQYFNVDPNNTECSEDVEVFTQGNSFSCIAICSVQRFSKMLDQILEPLCDFASRKPWELFSTRRSSLGESNKELLVPHSSPCASARIINLDFFFHVLLVKCSYTRTYSNRMTFATVKA